MIPILYDSTETTFTSNGLGRLRDCIDCRVTEGRNDVYECDFEYPIDGANFDLIQCGRTICVTHDESGDIQPFDIVSYSKPISGVASFHAVHVSYRQSGLVARGTNVNSLSAAFAMLGTAQPSNPFTYETDFASAAYMAAADGVPRSVRQMLGGVEGSILDAYGGEYEFDRFRVILHRNRGTARDFTIRYGVNMLDYQDDTDYSGTYSSCVPYWSGNNNGSDVIVVGDRVDLGSTAYNGRNVCAALDLSDKFERKPTNAQLQTLALSLMQSRQTTLPTQTITVDFVRLQDLGYEWLRSLMQCNLCDTINVAFPHYNMSGTYKIVKTVWNVLDGRYEKMELGALSTTLANALGITERLGSTSAEAMPIDGIIYRDYDFTVSYAAGTVGTRGAELTASGAVSGYVPISATVIAGNTYYNFFIARVATGGTVTLSAYRATTGARTGDAVTVRVVYKKE